MATRWGILGTSNISYDFMVAINTLPQTEHLVTAVASRDITRSQEFARQFDISKAYDSYLSVASDKEVGKHLSLQYNVYSKIKIILMYLQYMCVYI